MTKLPSRPIMLLFLAAATLPSLRLASLIWAHVPSTIMSINGTTVFQDFVVFWATGKIALAHDFHALASVQAYNLWLHKLINPKLEAYLWLYPPHVALLFVPFAMVSLGAAWAAWLIVTIAFLFAVLRWTQLSTTQRWLIAMSPAFLENLFDAQNGFLLTGAMLGAVLLAERNTLLAGLCLALLTFKPQLALVVPFYLLLTGRFRVIGWGILFAGLWISASVVLWGAGPWRDYITIILPTARAHNLDFSRLPFGSLYFQNLMVTPFAFVRGLGLDLSLAYHTQLLCSLAVLSLLAFVLRAKACREVSPDLKLALTFMAVPLVPPYALTYDMIGTAVAILLFLRAVTAPGGAVSRLNLYLSGLAWIVPGVSLYIGLATHVPGIGACVYGLEFLLIFREILARRRVPSRLPDAASGVSVPG